MLNKLIETEKDAGALAARLALGFAMFPHGAQKVLGLFGGAGFSDTMKFFTENMGIPWVFALLAIIAEFFGALGLITGLLTRVAAFGIGATMAVAVWMIHWSNGFFMNWSGDRAGEGWEYHLLVIGLAVVLMIRGGGALSLDSMLAARRSRTAG